MLDFPRTTEFNKRIPKQKFYENLTISPVLRRVFIDQIRMVYWKNKLATSTLNIAAGEAVTEIEVFEVRLNEPLLDEAVLKQIDKEIPYHLLFILTCDGKGSALIKDLESKDFGEIFTLLFSDAQFVQGTKALVNNKTWQFTKDEILAAIEAISENTVWDNLIGKDAVPLLRSDFAKVKSFRNDIMHAHSMETAKYNEAAKLIKEINKQLDAEIGNIIGTKETVQGDSAQDFNAALGDAIRNMDEAQSIKNWQEQLIALQSSIPTIKSENLTAALTAYTKIIDSPGFKAAQQLVSSPQWDSIQRSLKGISKIQTDISPALIELQKVASSIHQAVPPELLALQQSLQAFKPDPALLELLQKLNRWQDRLSDGQDKT